MTVIEHDYSFVDPQGGGGRLYGVAGTPPTSVYLETPTAELKVTRLQEVQQYERLFGLLQAQAVYGRDARRLITKALGEM